MNSDPPEPPDQPEPPDRPELPHLQNLAERWVAGWVVARRFPPADRTGDALRVEVGLPNRRFEFVTVDTMGADTAVSDVAADAIRTPGPNWVTVVTQRPDELRGPLRSAGLSVEGDIEWMMRIDLRDQAARAVPSPYRVEVHRDGDVLVASAFDAARAAGADEAEGPVASGGSASGNGDGAGAMGADGAGVLAASGRMSLVRTDAIADRILTLPGHKRRGLGSAIMGALATAAIAEGASTGILAASLEGERLYSRLGWHGVARLAVGRTPG